MSRALGKNVTALLKHGDHVAAYKDISAALTNQDESAFLEIELLGREYPLDPGTYVLRDGNAIAISKIGLLQSFFVARDVFDKHLRRDPAGEVSGVLLSTAVILLMDAEHYTAANSRKRLIQEAASKSDYADMLATEQWFMCSLFTSHLNRHNKSPTLWNHYRWLTMQALAAGQCLDIVGEFTKVILVAAERHPRNYYAWLHARWLMGLLLVRPDAVELKASILTATKAWVLKHHTDTSGWSFLYFLLTEEPASREACSSIFAEILDLALPLRWMNESVWVFLRTLAASKCLSDKDRQRFLSLHHSMTETVSGDAYEAIILQRAEEWYIVHSEAV